MHRTIQIVILSLTLAMTSGCNIENRSEDHVLRISFAPAYHEQWGWAAATTMVFDYYSFYYSQADLVDYHDYYYGYGSVSIDKISRLLRDLGGINSLVTGTLSFRDIRSHINSGNPILLHYGDYYSGHYVLLHGYDNNGYLYLHEPDYGTRVIHYDDLFTKQIYGQGVFWTSSLIISV